MRNALAVVLTIALFGVGGLFAANLTTTLDAPPLQLSVSSPAIDPAVASVAIAFYAAVNAMLAGDAGNALADVVGPTIAVGRDAGHQHSGVAALVDYVATLRRQGALELEPGPPLTDGSMLAVPIAIRRARDAPHALAGDTDAPLGMTIDLLNIVGERVVAYWPGTVVLSPPAPPPTVFPVESGEMALSLARIQLPAGATLDLGRPGPQLLLIESGSLLLHPEERTASSAGNEDVAVARVGETTYTQLTTMRGRVVGRNVVLNAGDALRLSRSSDFAVDVAGAEPAVLLSLRLAPRAEVRDPTDVRPHDGLTLAGAHNPSSFDRITWPDGAVTQTLAVTTDLRIPSEGGTVSLRTTHLLLPPGATEQMPAVDSARIVLVEAGVLTKLTGDPVRSSAAGIDPTTRIGLPRESQLLPSADPPVPPVALDVPTASALPLTVAGEALALPPAGLTLTNNGNMPATLLLLAASLNVEPTDAQRKAAAP